MFAHTYRQRTHLRRAAAKAAASLGWLVAVLAAVTGGLLAAAAVIPAAFAMTPEPRPLSGGQYRPVPAGSSPATTVHVVTADGMAGWQIALIALGAALVAAVVVVVRDRARAPSRHPRPHRRPLAAGPGRSWNCRPARTWRTYQPVACRLRACVNSLRGPGDELAGPTRGGCSARCAAVFGWRWS